MLVAKFSQYDLLLFAITFANFYSRSDLAISYKQLIKSKSVNTEWEVIVKFCNHDFILIFKYIVHCSIDI